MTTSILDHIVHLTPPGTGEETADQFRELGFNVIPGGTHADGLTANALVILADHVYLELIWFTNPPDAYPPGSPARQKRDAHKWAARPPGWIDYAFLGNGFLEGPGRISDMINGRVPGGEGALYAGEVPGGRTRVDGEVLRWVISAPIERGSILPFFCGDVTDRHLRVPTRPSSNTHHPGNDARGIAHILFLISPETFAATVKDISVVLDAQPFSHSPSLEAKWHLSTLNGLHSPTLVLATPADSEQAEFVGSNAAPHINEVGFFVGEKGKEGSVTTPFGRVVWVPVPV